MPPPPCGLISADCKDKMRRTRRQASEAQEAFRQAVAEALLDGGSVHDVAAFIELSSSTVERWGKEHATAATNRRAERDAGVAREAAWREFIKNNPDGPPTSSSPRSEQTPRRSE